MPEPDNIADKIAAVADYLGTLPPLFKRIAKALEDAKAAAPVNDRAELVATIEELKAQRSRHADLAQKLAEAAAAADYADDILEPITDPAGDDVPPSDFVKDPPEIPVDPDVPDPPPADPEPVTTNPGIDPEPIPADPEDIGAVPPQP